MNDAEVEVRAVDAGERPEMEDPAFESRRDVDPLLVAVGMGYGHLRAARALASALDVEVHRIDRPPIAAADEARSWDRNRWIYEALSRASQAPGLGWSFSRVLDMLTRIPPLPRRGGLQAISEPVRHLERLMGMGLGRTLVATLRESGAPLVTTFYAPAIMAERGGLTRIHCVVTDADIHRVWAPADARNTRILYHVPSRRVADRLQAFGVPESNVTLTGFPLPQALGRETGTGWGDLGGRLVRLDPAGRFRRRHERILAPALDAAPCDQEGKPPLVVFAVGGAGAQVRVAEAFLPRVRRAVETGRLRLALVAGTRRDVAERLDRAVDRAGLSGHLDGAVRVTWAPSFPDYESAFAALMRETDVLWTKPSELVFYAALGIPLLLAAPVGIHEHYNGAWVVAHGAALWCREPRRAASQLLARIADGSLAAAAWAGSRNLPADGTSRIAHAVRQ